jgi:hypothetical protein
MIKFHLINLLKPKRKKQQHDELKCCCHVIFLNYINDHSNQKKNID